MIKVILFILSITFFNRSFPTKITYKKEKGLPPIPTYIDTEKRIGAQYHPYYYVGFRIDHTGKRLYDILNDADAEEIYLELKAAYEEQQKNAESWEEEGHVKGV